MARTMNTMPKTKGLTPEEAVTLKNGLAALAEKHPKAEQQHGLTKIGNAVVPAPKPAVAVTTPAGAGPAAKPIASASPEAKVAPGGPAAPANAATAKPTIASTSPAEREKSVTTMPVATGHQPEAHVDLLKPSQGIHTDQAKALANETHVVHVEPTKPVVAPKVTSAPATAPKAPTLAAAKPPAPKAPVAPPPPQPHH
jgi:hypothetical protein